MSLRDCILFFGPFTLYFIAKLCRYAVLCLEDEYKNSLMQKILSVLWVLFSILSLPFTIVGALIGSLFANERSKQSLKAARLIYRVAKLLDASDEEQRDFAKANPQDSEFNFKSWAERELSEYGYSLYDLY